MPSLPYRLGVFVATLAATTAALSTGCSSSRVAGPTQLPVYGTDPLSHTTYDGSDAVYHHFTAWRGKTPTRYRIPLAQAKVEPATYPMSAGRRSFVRSTSPGVVRLIILQGASAATSAPAP